MTFWLQETMLGGASRACSTDPWMFGTPSFRGVWHWAKRLDVDLHTNLLLGMLFCSAY